MRIKKHWLLLGSWTKSYECEEKDWPAIYLYSVNDFCFQQQCKVYNFVYFVPGLAPLRFSTWKLLNSLELTSVRRISMQLCDHFLWWKYQKPFRHFLFTPLFFFYRDIIYFMTEYLWHEMIYVIETSPFSSLLRCRMLEVPSLQLTLSVTVPGLLRQTRSEVSPSVERAEYWANYLYNLCFTIYKSVDGFR